MVLLHVGRLERRYNRNLVEIPREIVNGYWRVFQRQYRVKIRIYLVRIYNTEGIVTKEYGRLIDVDIYSPQYSLTHYLDFSDLCLREGIPDNYFLQYIIISFIRYSPYDNVETPIFPNEFKIEFYYDLPERIKILVENEREALERIGSDAEIISILYELGLEEIAKDLNEGLKRFHLADYEGSIKFFRKVVEGLKNLVSSRDISSISSNRREVLIKYLTKAFHLISNFGEHSGTHGFMPEARLSMEIATSTCRYLINYLKEGS